MIHVEIGSPQLASKYAIAASSEAHKLDIRDYLQITWALIVCGESEIASKMLLRIDPRNPAMKIGLWGAARQLGMLELHSDALRFIESVTEPSLRNTSVSTLHGHLLSVVGRPEDAAACFEEAIGVDPVSPLAHLMLSRLGLPAAQAHRINRVRRLIAQGGVNNLDHLAMLQFALFGELDAMGETDAAWSALEAGCAARNQLNPYRFEDESRVFDTIIATMSRPSVGSPPLLSTSHGKKPIFIVGMPRTGTTLLERILGNHPDVQTCGELTAFVQQHQWVSNRVWGDMFDLKAAAEQHLLDSDLLGDRYLRAVSWRCNNSPYFTDKTPGNFMAIGLILKALPDARIIHLRRTPIDACFSNLKVLFAPDVYSYSYSLNGLAGHYYNYSRLMEHWNNTFPGRILDVEYEELAASPALQAVRILSYCGLPPREGITEIESNNSSVSTESRSQVREPIHTRNIGGWRRYEHYLSPLASALNSRSPHLAG